MKKETPVYRVELEVQSMKNERFEWLTEEICREYKARADQLSGDNSEDIDAWRALRQELQDRCHITEVQAYNILRGYNVRDYLNYYGILSGAIPIASAPDEKHGKNIKKKSMAEKMREYEDRIADLESLAQNSLSSFDFEEKD